MNTLLLGFGIALSILFFAAALWLTRPSRESELLDEITNYVYQHHPGGKGRLSPEEMLKPLRSVRKLFGGPPNPETVRRLMLAGYRKPFHVEAFLGARLVVPVVAGIVSAVFFTSNPILWFTLSVLLGILAPDLWLNLTIKKRRERIRLSLPDALDFLAICVESGLGLDQAIVKVAREIRFHHPELSDELVQINLEQRAGKPRVEAWRHLAERTNLDVMRSFVHMLIQTERFGTPVSKSLGVFSDSLRTQRRQKAEEMAAKTTVKLIFPLVVFIFPSIFIVTIIPAVITLIASFGKFFS